VIEKIIFNLNSHESGALFKKAQALSYKNDKLMGRSVERSLNHY
tara:strand:- start:806 stop:937 length:132 start_codon:yes stop_codon:yes gene_type:complete